MNYKTSVAFAVLLPVLAGCSVMQSIDRGLHSAAGAVSQRDRITGTRTLSLQSRAQQIQKGNEISEAIVAEFSSKEKRFNDDYDPVAYNRVRRILNSLLYVSHLSGEKWTPVLVEDNEFNAFVTGGTYIFVNSGLEKELRDDSELANVIAHELAHTVANHVFERQSFTNLNSLAGSKAAKRDSFQAAFTHENEKEADRVGILYAALAGYDPYAGERVWRRQFEKAGNENASFHTHPINSERAANAKKIADKAIKYYTAAAINPSYQEILKKNDIFSTKEYNGVNPGDGGGFLALVEVVGTTMSQKSQARTEEVRQQSRNQTLQYIKNNTKIVSSKAVGKNSWQFTFNYRGGLAMTDIAFKMAARRSDGSRTIVIKSIAGVLRPNSTFDVVFDSPELDAYRIDPRNVAVIYESARNL